MFVRLMFLFVRMLFGLCPLSQTVMIRSESEAASETCSQIELEYCFAREKAIVFAQQKQSVPMSINNFVKRISFSI